MLKIGMYLKIFHSVVKLMQSRNLQHPYFLQIYLSFNSCLMKFESELKTKPHTLQSVQNFIEIMKTFSELIIEVAMEIKQQRNIYTFVLLHIGESVLNTCKSNPNLYKCPKNDVVFYTMFMSLSIFLNDNDVYYDTYSQRWEKDKLFLKEIGCTIAQILN